MERVFQASEARYPHRGAPPFQSICSEANSGAMLQRRCGEETFLL